MPPSDRPNGVFLLRRSVGCTRCACYVSNYRELGRSKRITEWIQVQNKQLSAAEFRQEYISAHGIGLQALALVGRDLIKLSDSEKQTKLLAMIKETGFMAIPFDSFVIKDETVDFVKYGVKITYNEKTNQLFWPEQEATEQSIPPIITEVEIELESILNSIRE